MNIVVVGLSHKTAPVEIRERVAFAPTAMEKPLHEVSALPAITETVIVSTCNRVEIYATGREADATISQLKRFLASYHDLAFEDIEEHLYDFQGEEAIKHIYRVASSLDSMVIGEPQILGQIKTAYGYATEFKTTGIILNRLLHKAFSVAKRVRTETKIAGSAVSVAFAAVELSRKIFDTLEDKTVMLIGAGEMCELAARHFIGTGVREVLVTNRTRERAVKLAEEFEGKAVAFENFPHHLHRVDIILTSTGASDFILEKKQVAEVIRQRRNKPMFMIDIAVPRDIDPSVNQLDNIYLYDVDDLQHVVQANLKERKKEAKSAEAIVGQEVGQFHKWLSNLEVVPTIVSLRQCLEEVRQQEMDKSMARMTHLGEKDKKAIDALTRSIVNKILHNPTAVLKQSQGDAAGDTYVDAIRTLFDLPQPSGEEE